MTVFGMLAWFAAAVSLWLGARRYDHAIGRAYQWLAAGAGLYCSGLIVLEFLGGTLNPAPGLSFTNLPALLALAVTGVGTGVLATAERDARSPRPDAPDGGDGHVVPAGARDSVLPGLADGYVMAVALLVIGWTAIFSAEFHKSGDRPGTFLLGLVHPLADLAVLGALLPMVTAAWRRVMLPYLAVGVIAVGDSLAVGQRVLGGHPGIAAQLLPVFAALLLGAAPWRVTEGFGSNWTRRATSSAASTIVAALTAAAATLFVIVNGLAGAPASGVALIVAGGAGVLVLAGRVFMLVRENLAVLGIWRESSRSLRDLASRTSDVVLVCDLDGSVRYASPTVADYGYAPGTLTGRRLLDYVHPEDRSAVLASVRLALGGYQPSGMAPAGPRADSDSGESAEGSGAAGASGRFRVRVRAADGTWRHIESTLLRYQAPGEPIQMLVTARDVSDQVALRQQVTHLTFHDGLTGLPNRAYVEERARDVLRDAAPGQPGDAGRTGVIFLDIDRFTAVNDSVGHGAGDLVLAQAARRLRAVVPVHDTVARWGSDEFAVLVENAGSDQEVAEIADRLAGAVAAEPFRVAGQQIALTASVGVALADLGPGDPPGLVLRNADVAMSRAKDSGGDRVEVYAAHMHADVVRRLEIVSDLQRAISEGELTLQFQPIVDLATSRVTGAEALVRWWRGDQVVSPREFLGAAEESGLIVPLGEWVLREACAQGAAWRHSSGGSVLGHRDLGEPVRPADHRAGLRRPAGRDPGRDRAAARGAHRRGERADPGRRGRADHRAAGRPAPAGREAGPGRLRHRLRLAGLPAPPPAGHHQDRPLVRGRARPGRDAHAADQDRGPGRARPRAARHRRGHRAAAAADRAARDGLRVRPGVPGGAADGRARGGSPDQDGRASGRRAHAARARAVGRCRK